MPSKIETYTELAAQTAAKVAKDFSSWTAFLSQAARLYKYKFREQLLIHAQRPNATACAEYRTWTEQMRRYVRRAAKGIAVIRDVDGVPTLRYVFDVADTGTTDNGLHLYFWTAQGEFLPVVAAALEQCFLVPADDKGLSVQLAEKYWTTYKNSLPNAIKGSALKKNNRGYKKAFLDAAAASITYVLLSRCGLEPEQLFDEGDFAHVFECDTQESVMALGDAVSQCAELPLRTIEHEIRQYLRSKRTEQRVKPSNEPAAA